MTLRFTFLFSVLLLSSLSDAAEWRPTSKRDIIVYEESRRYGGWPANQGIWAWGDEVVVGFTAGWYKAVPSGHAIDSSKPYEKWQARSLDGGSTWSVEKPPQLANAGVMPKQTKLSQPLDFTAQAFALMFQTYNYNTGPSWFHVSADRGRTWSAAFEFAVEGIEKIATRTDYLVLGPRDCLMFGSAAKANGKEGRAWGDEIILRDDALTSDLGYCRSIARADGQVLTLYYYNGPKPEDRTIQATRWKP